MGSKRRYRKSTDYSIRLVIEKERAVYWVCALLERDGEETRAGARRALFELGYDQRRIDAMLLLGEPGPARAGEARHVWPRVRARTWSRASEGPPRPALC